VIYNAADTCVLEEIEANMAFYEIYDGAIYMYQVRRACLMQAWCVCAIVSYTLAPTTCMR
jgi:hypothetical protein